MQLRWMGNTSLQVTEISFGCAGIGNLYRRVTRDDAELTLATAWDAGIRYFDTAPYYGHGLSERRLGDFLRQKQRQSFILSTKVGRLLMPVNAADIPDHGYVDPLPFAIHYDYSYNGIMHSFEASLQRLGLNCIDILYVHDIGTLTHGSERNKAHMENLLGGGLSALQQLKSEGAIKAFGIGVNEVACCLEIMDYARLDVILLAGRYTLLDRSAEFELLKRCRDDQTALVIGGVFNSGILATGPGPDAHFDYEPAKPDIQARVQAMSEACHQQNVPLASASLRFALKEPMVASVLIGTAKPTSLRRNLDLLTHEIPEALWPELESHALGPNRA
ncbi:MAG: aldo/keto reductase [Acidocella sp.]|nr:aldo/keto reductase [Acidocella sp.]